MRQQTDAIAIEFDMTGIDLIAIVPHGYFHYYQIKIFFLVFPAIASLILNRLLLASLHENVTVAFEISNINIASVPDITAIQWFYITHPSDEALAFNSSNLLNFTNSVYRSNDHTVFSLSTNNLSLTIYNVTMENQGRYYLRAENSKGNSNSDYVDVIIKGKSIFPNVLFFKV